MLYLHNPVNTRFYPPCFFRVLTGLYCPGCGSTRALYQLIHGHVYRALDLNPLLLLAAPVLAYLVLTHAVLSLTGRRVPAFNLPVAGIWAVMGVVVAFWIARNIPVSPFTWLAP